MLLCPGVGKSKKLSKRDAALKMLQQVKDGMMVMQPKCEPTEDNDEDSMPLVGDTDSYLHHQDLVWHLSVVYGFVMI